MTADQTATLPAKGTYIVDVNFCYARASLQLDFAIGAPAFKLADVMAAR
jgi:hypothetical protein